MLSGEVVPGAVAGFATFSLLCGRPGGGITEDGLFDAVVAVSALSVVETRAHSRDLRWIACPGAVTVLKPGRGWLDEGACSRSAPMYVEDGVQHVVVSGPLQSWC